MIVLFVNAHKNTNEGQSRFQIYHRNIKKILKQTVYYGNDIEQVVRTKFQLQDFLFDEKSYRVDEKAKQKFQSVQYVFIDGPFSVPPWSSSMKQVLLLIKMCVKGNKKFHVNGFGHLALYFYITTHFEKDYVIVSTKTSKQEGIKSDYQYNEQNGDFYVQGKKFCHSGIKCQKLSSRPFSSKSSSAVNQGAVLPTKFHYLVFDSKNGNKILNNIKFPFSFYYKGRIFCTPKQISQAKVDVLVQTQNHIPLAYTLGEGLSTHGLSPQFLKILFNWVCQKTGQKNSQCKEQFTDFKSISLENKLIYKKTLVHHQSTQNIFSKQFTSSKTRPNSSKFSQPNFQKPSVRCSGAYQTHFDIMNKDYMLSRVNFLGKSRMVFKTDIQKNQIKNYVTQTPSRPPSSHKYREVHKNKWMCKDTFFVS